MSRFPTLKTGVVMQYPSTREVWHPTGVLRFLDGGEQRYPEAGSAGHRWVIPLRLLEDSEWAAIEQLFVAVGGRSGSFAFQDPFDGTEYPDCSFEQDELAIRQADEGRGEVVAVIKENRGTS